MQEIPPYVENPDAIRCGQAVISMILKHFDPTQNHSLSKADMICGYIDGKHSWDTAAARNMLNLGFQAINTTDFDTNRFIADPQGYLLEIYGQELSAYTLENIALDYVVNVEQSLLTAENYRHDQRDWQWADVTALLADGYLLMAWVNSRQLYHRSGDVVAGHFVLLFNYDPDLHVVMFHDPGYHVAINEQSVLVNAWRSARIGADHFMNAAKSPHGTGGLSILAFKPLQDR